MRALVSVLGSLWLALAITSCAKKPDTTAAEQAVRKRIQELDAAIQARDSTAVASFYAEDAHFMPPNQPALRGRDKVRPFFGAIFQAPNFSLMIEPNEVLVARAADMAVEVGSYRLGMDAPVGSVRDQGKYAVTWKDIAGTWQIVVDIFNSDLPPAPVIPPGGAPSDTSHMH